MLSCIHSNHQSLRSLLYSTKSPNSARISHHASWTSTIPHSYSIERSIAANRTGVPFWQQHFLITRKADVSEVETSKTRPTLLKFWVYFRVFSGERGSEAHKAIKLRLGAESSYRAKGTCWHSALPLSTPACASLREAVIGLPSEAM